MNSPDLRDAALAQQAKIDEIAIEQWKLRMVFYDENGEPSMSRQPEPDEIRAALAQLQPDPVDEYRKGFIAGQIDMRDREQAEPVEPVAWRFKTDAWFDGNVWHDAYEVTTDKSVAEWRGRGCVTPLYTAPPQQAEPTKSSEEA